MPANPSFSIPAALAHLAHADPLRPADAPHLLAYLAAMDHTTRAVLAQRQVDGAPGEVPGFAPLLAGLELAGAVVTADALHTHADAAEFVVTTKQAHYLFTVKANQPTLLARCGHLPWRNVPCWTAPATAPTAAWSCAPSRPLPSTTSGPRTPPRSSSMRSPASPSPRPVPPAWPTCCVGTGRSRSVKQTAPMECDR